MSAPGRRVLPLAALAGIAAVQGLGLIGYAIFDLEEALRLGATGPEEVSSIPAIVLLIVTLFAFGAGMLWVARGWWLVRRWARSPFLLTQILTVLLGYDLVQSDGAVVRSVGGGMALLAVVGIVLALVPPVSRALEQP